MHVFTSEVIVPDSYDSPLTLRVPVHQHQAKKHPGACRRQDQIWLSVTQRNQHQNRMRSNKPHFFCSVWNSDPITQSGNYLGFLNMHYCVCHTLRPLYNHRITVVYTRLFLITLYTLTNTDLNSVILGLKIHLIKIQLPSSTTVFIPTANLHLLKYEL